MTGIMIILIVMSITMMKNIVQKRMVSEHFMDTTTRPISMIQPHVALTSMLTVAYGKLKIGMIEYAMNIGATSMMNVCGNMSELYVNSVNLLTRIKTVDIYA